jgi:hypothetical protein
VTTVMYSTVRTGVLSLCEVRCPNCRKLLAKAAGTARIEIKCPRCPAGVTTVAISS